MKSKIKTYIFIAIFLGFFLLFTKFFVTSDKYLDQGEIAYKEGKELSGTHQTVTINRKLKIPQNHLIATDAKDMRVDEIKLFLTNQSSYSGLIDKTITYVDEIKSHEDAYLFMWGRSGAFGAESKLKFGYFEDDNFVYLKSLNNPLHRFVISKGKTKVDFYYLKLAEKQL